jgi:hypothetical protein
MGPALPLALCLGLAACNSFDGVGVEPTAKVYVVVSSEKTASFTKDLSAIVARRGQAPNLGSATDGNGYAAQVLDATGPSARIRSQNLLLSGHEDPSRCGAYGEPHSDPGQFSISVTPNRSGEGSREAQALLTNIVSDLKTIGYTVQAKPELCSALSKAAAR